MSVKDLAAELEAAIGINDPRQEVRMFLSTGYPKLDYEISGHYHGGGFPLGRIVEMFGPPSSGKTAIATCAMATAQRNGGVAAFFDHERSFDVGQGVALGLNVDPGQWVYKAPKTFEESIATAMNMAKVIREKSLIDPDAPIVCVFDSLASMVPQSKFNNIEDKGVAALNMSDNTALARATSASFPALAQWCEQYEMLALFLNQARTKIGVMFGDPTTTPGGNAPEFYASVRVKLGRSQLTKTVGGAKVRIGQRIGAEIIKNKVYRPFGKCEWDFLYQEDGTGKFDVIGSSIDALLEMGRLEKAGNNIEWDGKKFPRSTLIERIAANDETAKLLELFPESA
tara:strand:+ start:1072 stop:2094 length:1023 start_codon:yes stop_codon:yes gene_type:complete